VLGRLFHLTILKTSTNHVSQLVRGIPRPFPAFNVADLVEDLFRRRLLEDRDMSLRSCCDARHYCAPCREYEWCGGKDQGDIKTIHLDGSYKEGKKLNALLL
jgi:hypothetical protein